MKIKFFNRIHHIFKSYGYIVIPFYKYSLFYFDNYGFRIETNEYHNCTKTGIY